MGVDSADDAGVYRLDESTGLILTVDFFTPIVDDPYKFGAIAAANALSDVYAMGGTPLAALNICAFPPEDDKNMLREIIKGGADKVAEAGAVIAGGHSVRDEDLKYGLAVIGRVEPESVVTNAGAVPGDKLVLTKPIGTGLLSTARKKDAISEDEFEPAVELMLTLNNKASEAMIEAGANACTDITGYGLLGHAGEMAIASKAGLAIDVFSVPLLPLARQCAQNGNIPGGAKKNRDHFGKFVDGDPYDEACWGILFDPQTSGGLLISVPESKADDLMTQLQKESIDAAIIGEVIPEPKGRIVIRS